VLDAAGILPNARFVMFYSYDEWADAIDMFDALHPQTILAYGMNGRELPIAHGAPVRLRVERQLGQRSMKYLQRIVVKEEFDDGGKNGSIQNGWAWYMGI
jgi:DMSO/TMAO reductase YedYZ molybdopterin-dependent catalytic subunit